jgi:hypothetical protein
MARKRFTTNTRIWLAVSLVLFIPPWFIGHIDKNSDMTAAGLFGLLVSDPPNIGAVVGGIFACMFWFGVPALAVGWVLHCPIVIVLGFFRRRRHNAA